MILQKIEDVEQSTKFDDGVGWGLFLDINQDRAGLLPGEDGVDPGRAQEHFQGEGEAGREPLIVPELDDNAF